MKNVTFPTVSALALALLISAPVHAQDANDTAAPAAAGTTMTAAPAAHDKDVDGRIKGLHDKLKITKDQEAMWGPVASVMYDNAMAARAEYQERQDKQSSMTALDDIKSSQMHSEERAQGLQKLVDAFAPLYQAMTPAQQQNADKVFGHEHKAHSDAMKKGSDKE